jgi:hypothetical protein
MWCFELVAEQAEIVREIGRVFVACDGVVR